MRKKIIAISTILLLLTGIGAAADWSIDNKYFLPDQVTNQSQGIVVFQVNNQYGNPVNPEDCNSTSVWYKYPTPTQENTYTAEHIKNSEGYYYGNITATTLNETVNVEAVGAECEGFSRGDALSTASISPKNNITLELLNQTGEGLYLEGENYSLQFNSTYNETFYENATVEWGIYNHTGYLETSGGTNNSTSYYYNNSVKMPEEGGLHFLRINATNNSAASFENPEGGTAIPFQIETHLEGDLIVNNTEGGCNTDTTRCEKGATLDLYFNEDSNKATNVSVNVTGNSSEIWSGELNEEDDGLWKTSYDVNKTLNVTRYTRTLDINLTAESDLSNYSTSKQVELTPYNISERGTSTSVSKGSEFDIEFQTIYPYSGMPLEKDQMDQFYVEMSYPNGSQLFNDTVGENGDISDEYYSKDSQSFLYSYSIPDNCTIGDYSIIIRSKGVYGAEETKEFQTYVYEPSEEDSNLIVKDISSSISSSDSTEKAEKEFKSTGLKEGNVVIVNNGTEPAIYNITYKSDFSGITNSKAEFAGSMHELPAVIYPERQHIVKLNFTLDERTDYVGGLVFEVEGNTYQYQRTVDVNFSFQEEETCKLKNGTLCLYSQSVDRYYNTTGEKLLNVVVENQDGNNTTVEANPQGNLSSIIEKKEEEITAQSNTSFSFHINGVAENNGVYQDNITFIDSSNNTINLSTSIEMDVPEGSISAGPLYSKDLGTVVKGEAFEFPIQINNTGDRTVQNITISSNDLNIDSEIKENEIYVSIEPEGSVNHTLTIDTDTIAAESHTGDSEAEFKVTSSSGVSDSFQVSLVVKRNLTEEFDSLESTASDIEDRIVGLTNVSEDEIKDLNDTLESVRDKISRAKTAWGNKNYERADTVLSKAEEDSSGLQSTLDEVESSDTGGGEDEQNGEGTDSKDGEGGINPMLIILPLIILGVVGVVVYLSLVPEEEEGSEGPKFPTR
ncbi:MAG: hypothetical protein MUP58_02620 [Candidatus Nanohaloarchaeota archaeon QJJ-9]|nr:hypothetical protein [Candidatus Nanohaloarchaeota archaeon QJJ-9]